MRDDGPDYAPLLSLLPHPLDDGALLLLACADPSPPGQWQHALVECAMLALVSTRRTHTHVFVMCVGMCLCR